MPNITFGKMKIPVVYLNRNGTCHYDPETRKIYIYQGKLSNATRMLLSGRDTEWTTAHELGHAVLDRLSSGEHVKLEKIFGSFDEDDYSGSFFSEAAGSLFGYDEATYLTPRASMCPEEDFAEVFAFVCQKGTSKPGQNKKLKAKIVAVQALFASMKEKPKALTR